MHLDCGDYVRMHDGYALTVRSYHEGKEIPKPKNKGVVNMIVRGRTFARRNSGIIHPRKTISSLAGP